MSDPFLLWLDQAAPGLTQAVIGQLRARRGSVFYGGSDEAVTQAVTGLVTALRADLQASGTDSLRRDLKGCLRALSSEQLAFRDLRALVMLLRSALLAGIDQAPQLPADTVRRLDDWCLELTLQIGLQLLAWREEVIDRQASEIEARLAEQRQLSIPIAPIYEGVLAIPLVGAMDAYRAEVLTERVLKELTHSRAQILLLDISGVTAIDREIASYLLRVAQAARLLGAEMVWVGISPEAARIITHLDVDLSGLITLRSLQDGLAYALSRLSRRIVTTAPDSAAAPEPGSAPPAPPKSPPGLPRRGARG